MTPLIRRAWPAAAVAALALAGCADDPPPEPVPGGTLPPPVVTEPTSPPPTDEPTESRTQPPAGAPTDVATDPAALPPFEPAGIPQTAEPSGEPLLPVAVRVGEHAGFERVVIELAGDGLPGWQTEYVTRAIEDGSGAQVDVDGDAILSVRVTGTRYPEESEEHPARHVVEGEDAVDEVHFLGTFEGVTQLFIGVDDGVADYRVIALTAPPRLVIDIEDVDP